MRKKGKNTETEMCRRKKEKKRISNGNNLKVFPLLANININYSSLSRLRDTRAESIRYSRDSPGVLADGFTLTPSFAAAFFPFFFFCLLHFVYI